MMHKNLGRVLAAGFVLALSGAPQATALPPGGAATSNTPGTSSSVSPTDLKACETIYWEVTGFAPNEQVNVKVDDGAVSGGDASVQGQGVLSTAMADGSGTASNSFEVPCDLEVGPHSLRFLATAVINEDKGETKGYTNRSQDFYIVADGDSAADTGAGSGSGSGGNESGGSGSASGGGNAGGGAVIGGGSDDDGGQVTRRTVVRQNGAGGANDSGRGSGGSAGSRSAGAQAGNSAKSAKNKSNGSKPKSSNDILKASGGADEGDDATYADDGTVLAANQSANGAPVVGLSVGGAILIVGLAAVAAYLYVNGGRRDAAGPTASDDTQQINRVQR